MNTSEMSSLFTAEGLQVLTNHKCFCCFDMDHEPKPDSALHRCCTFKRHLTETTVAAKRNLLLNPCAGGNLTALEYQKQINHNIKGKAKKIDEVSLKIHAKPELNYEEFLAHEVLTTFLEDEGFKVEKSWLGVRTAFRACFGKGEPVIAVCAEYDALPEIGHACGHNLISSAALTAAVGAKAFLENNPGTSGTIQIIGTPAEEGGGGKVVLINRGGFKGVDIAMMVHPAPLDILYPKFLAIERIVVEFFGKNAHASASPHEGVNALDAIVQFFNNIGLARQQMYPSWRVHGIITHGGVKANIIPDYTRAEVYIRAPKSEDLVTLKQKVHACADGAAIATGCKVKYGNTADKDGVIELPYTELFTNPTLAELYRANAALFNKGFLPKEVEQSIPTGSTDMGNVSLTVPSIHPTFRIPSSPGEGNHHPGFTACAKTEEALDEARNAGSILAYTAVDIFTNPLLVNEAKREFAKGQDSFRF